jgi:membrane peptidoglycan carboxypeptidase
MADAYSVLAANGTLHQLVEIKSIKGPDNYSWTPTETTTQPISANVAATETSLLTGVIHNSDGTANQAYNSASLRMNNIAGKTGTSTMDITPDTTTAMQQVNYNDHGGSYDTAGIWFDGYSSKLSLSVGISRWTDVKINGTLQTVQLPVDNIQNLGNDYGASYPFSIWDKFMQLMQGTSYGGDTAFPTPVANPNATVWGSPTPTASATTSSAPPSTQAPATSAAPPSTARSTTPSLAPTTPSASATTCQAGLLNPCQSPTPSGSTSSSPTATNTGKFGNNANIDDNGGP